MFSAGLRACSPHNILACVGFWLLLPHSVALLIVDNIVDDDSSIEYLSSPVYFQVMGHVGLAIVELR